MVVVPHLGPDDPTALKETAVIQLVGAAASSAPTSDQLGLCRLVGTSEVRPCGGIARRRRYRLGPRPRRPTTHGTYLGSFERFRGDRLPAGQVGRVLKADGRLGPHSSD
ncbi:MAG: hypothetical protein LC808_36080, partial [Actinobacteria bacterium]|nr:hypothetical protein [Actinomycetota bacterium]